MATWSESDSDVKSNKVDCVGKGEGYSDNSVRNLGGENI